MLFGSRPAIVVDDQMTSPIRLIRVGSEVTSCWADWLTVVSDEEFESALIGEMGHLPRALGSVTRGRRSLQ